MAKLNATQHHGRMIAVDWSLSKDRYQKVENQQNDQEEEQETKEEEDNNDSDSSSSSSSSSEDEGEVVASTDSKSPQNNDERNQKEKTEEASDDHSRVKSLSKGLSKLMRRSPSTRSRKASKEAESSVAAAATATEVAIHRPEPRVLHGHTLTKEVAFRDVCHAIRDSAFVASDLPVIVSLEVHASLEQQQVMVDIMREAWKGLLVDITPDLDPANCALPRLEDVKRKILIKVKRAPPSQGAEGINGENSHETSEQEKSLENATDAKDDTLAKTTSKKASKILQALSELAVYTRAYHFSHFTQPGMYSSSSIRLLRNCLLLRRRGNNTHSCVLPVGGRCEGSS